MFKNFEQLTVEMEPSVTAVAYGRFLAALACWNDNIRQGHRRSLPGILA